MIRPEEVLGLYDREIRQYCPPIPGGRVERDGSITRLVGSENFVIYSSLTVESAPAVVAAEVDRFRRAGVAVEWKTFGHDRPANLDALLSAAGFVPDAPETIVVYDLEDGIPGGTRPPGVDVRQVTDEDELAVARRVNEAAFGPDGRTSPERWTEWLRDPSEGLFVAYVDGTPAASGRVDLPEGRSFAGLFGGGTAPPYRHRGVYRALVSARAELAKSRGYRFVTVDARATSRPILERIGFVFLTTTRGWVLHPATGTPTRSMQVPP